MPQITRYEREKQLHALQRKYQHLARIRLAADHYQKASRKARLADLTKAQGERR